MVSSFGLFITCVCSPFLIVRSIRAPHLGLPTKLSIVISTSSLRESTRRATSELANICNAEAFIGRCGSRAVPVFRQVPNKCAPSQHHFEYFALHSLESIQLVDWNAECSQGSSGKEEHEGKHRVVHSEPGNERRAELMSTLGVKDHRCRRQLIRGKL